MKLHKKGLFTPYLLVLTLILLGSLSYGIVTTRISDEERSLGENQLEILKAYASAEKQQFYLEQAALLAADAATVKLTKNGFIADTSQCETLQGTVIWNPNSACNPDIYNNFLKVFVTELNLLLEQTKYQYQLNDLNIVDGSILARTQQQIKIESSTKQLTLTHEIPANFKIQLPLNLENYDNFKNQVFAQRSCIAEAAKSSRGEDDVADCLPQDFTVVAQASTVDGINIIKIEANQNEQVLSKEGLIEPYMTFILKLGTDIA